MCFLCCLTLIARQRYVSMRCVSWPAAICISIQLYELYEIVQLSRCNLTCIVHSDLNDILQIVLELETENTPIFLARNLSNLPPLSYNHFDLGKIINDIEALKNDMQIAVHVAKSHDEILRAIDQLTKRCDERSVW